MGQEDPECRNDGHCAQAASRTFLTTHRLATSQERQVQSLGPEDQTLEKGVSL